jgi:D-glycero-alpha-D-manno-heptose-7-phosphate kinase
MIDNLHFIKDLGYRSKTALETGNLIKFAELMNEHWQHKKKRSSNMSNDQINQWYELALKNGALGGKRLVLAAVVLMFYTEDKIVGVRHA